MRNPPENNEGQSLAYVDRVNRAIDFILRHLDQPLRLEVVARAACFSPFHFHRIFRLLVGESLNEFVKRVRLERALALMSQASWSTRRQVSLTDVAFACGFASSSDFARCFKGRYGIPPSCFDVASFRARRREEWQTAVADPAQRNLLDKLRPGTNPDGFEVRVRRLPPRRVAYTRVLRPFGKGRRNRPPNGWCAGRAGRDWPMDNGLATCGTIQRSPHTRTAVMT